MARRAEAAPNISPRLLESLGELLGQLGQFNLTLAPSQTQKPSLALSINDFIPDVAPFSGSLEQDGITVDEWRIRMRLKLMQFDQIMDQKTLTTDKFKANYILSMLTGRAWLAIKERHVDRAGMDPTDGFRSAEHVLECVCDTIKDKCRPAMSEKAGHSY